MLEKNFLCVKLLFVRRENIMKKTIFAQMLFSSVDILGNSCFCVSVNIV